MGAEIKFFAFRSATTCPRPQIASSDALAESCLVDDWSQDEPLKWIEDIWAEAYDWRER
jgi:hypothetical protein